MNCLRNKLSDSIQLINKKEITNNNNKSIIKT